MIKGLFQIVRALWIVFWNMDKMPTDEQLRAKGIEPVRYNNPPPSVFNQGGSHRGPSPQPLIPSPADSAALTPVCASSNATATPIAP